MTQFVSVEVFLNGEHRQVDVQGHQTLLHVLREVLDLTGSKECCAEGECGACTVLLDGKAVNACLVLAAEVDGHEVTTIEGLTPAELSPLQASFLEHGAVQCGFCIPGMVVAAHALLERKPNPSLEDVREDLSGNLCRCAGYNQICAAVLDTATEVQS